MPKWIGITGQSKSIPRFEMWHFKTEGGLGRTIGKYRESSRYAHFGTGKNSHKWKIAYLESNVVMPCKVNLTIRMSNAQSSTYTV